MPDRGMGWRTAAVSKYERKGKCQQHQHACPRERRSAEQRNTLPLHAIQPRERLGALVFRRWYGSLYGHDCRGSRLLLALLAFTPVPHPHPLYTWQDLLRCRDWFRTGLDWYVPVFPAREDARHHYTPLRYPVVARDGRRTKLTGVRAAAYHANGRDTCQRGLPRRHTCCGGGAPTQIDAK